MIKIVYRHGFLSISTQHFLFFIFLFFIFYFLFIFFFFAIEEAKETVWNFSEEILQVLQIYFALT